MWSPILPERPGCASCAPLLRASAIRRRWPGTATGAARRRWRRCAKPWLGNYREEHVFALAQALERYDCYQEKVAACDTRIAAVLERLRQICPTPPARPLPPARRQSPVANGPGFAVREALYAVLGRDVTQIHGLGPSLVLRLVGECGTDLAVWPSEKHLTSWLSLAPHNKISGGQLLSTRTRRSGN